MDLLEALMILINNDEKTQETHFVMARRALKRALKCQQVKDGTWCSERAPIYLLAEELEEVYDIMTDDIVLDKRGYPSLAFTHQFRNGVIEAFVSVAFGTIDWHKFAEAILERYADVERTRTKAST